MVEIWKDVAGYEGIYQVSNLGRVKSLERDIQRSDGHFNHVNEKILSQVCNTNGYMYVMLSKNNKMKFCRVNRLTANAFIPNPDNLPQVGHYDECKTHNWSDNLYWTTNKENNNMPLRKLRGSLSSHKRKPVYCVELSKNFNSIIEAAKEVGGSRQTISRCLKGRIKTAAGYHWRYA